MKFQTLKCCINAKMPVRACGFAQQGAPLTEVRDSLYARIFVFEQNEERYVLIALDSLGCPKPVYKRLKEELQAGCDKPMHLVVTATHTHFAPDLKVEEYADQFIAQMKEALGGIVLEEMDLTCSFVREPFFKVGSSRISHWETDQIFAQALCFYNKGKRIASLLIHNCHPTVLNGFTPFFTCEYPGLAVKHLEEKYPDEFFAYLEGACGDVSTRFTRKDQSVEQMEEFGQIMADEFISLLEKAVEKVPCKMEYKDYLLQVEHDLKDPSKLVIPEYYSEREKEVLVYGIERSKINLEHPEKLEKETLMSVLKFGQFNLIFAQFELFSEYNMATDANHSALICYSQGYSHYVAGPSFDGMTYESLQDTLSDKSRAEIMNVIKENSDF